MNNTAKTEKNQQRGGRTNIATTRIKGEKNRGINGEGKINLAAEKVIGRATAKAPHQGETTTTVSRSRYSEARERTIVKGETAENMKELRLTRPEHENEDLKIGKPGMTTATKLKKAGGKQKGT